MFLISNILSIWFCILLLTKLNHWMVSVLFSIFTFLLWFLFILQSHTFSQFTIWILYRELFFFSIFSLVFLHTCWDTEVKEKKTNLEVCKEKLPHFRWMLKEEITSEKPQCQNILTMKLYSFVSELFQNWQTFFVFFCSTFIHFHDTKQRQFLHFLLFFDFPILPQIQSETRKQKKNRKFCWKKHSLKIYDKQDGRKK